MDTNKCDLAGRSTGRKRSEHVGFYQMERRGFQLAWALCAVLWAAPVPAAPGEAGQPLPTRPEELFVRLYQADQRLFPSDRIPWMGNEQGRLGWTEAYAIRAYVRAAQLTEGPYWLEKARRHVEQVLRRTDRARGLRDYRGERRAGWSSIDRSAKGARIVWLVDTAHLGEAMLAVADLVEQRDPAQASWSTRVREAVATALREFDPWWRPGPDGMGLYVFPADEPHPPGQGRQIAVERGLVIAEVPLPWNQQLMAARAMFRLARHETGSVWHDRMSALVRAWLREVRLEDDGGWTWPYWGAPMTTVYPNVEPVHYAGIALGLMHDLIAAGDPIVEPTWDAAARATVQRVIQPDRMATDLRATRWIPVSSLGSTTPTWSVQLAEWGAWTRDDCVRWRTSLRSFWSAGDSPSSWLGWMELLTAGWCEPVVPAPPDPNDPFAMEP